MLIIPSDESKELLRRSLSLLLETSAEQLHMFSAILPFLKRFKITNGLGILTNTITNIIQLNQRLTLPLSINKESLLESYEINWMRYAKSKHICELTELSDEYLTLEIGDQAIKIKQLLLTDLMDEYNNILELTESTKGSDLLMLLASLKESYRDDLTKHYLLLMGQCTTQAVYINGIKYEGNKGVRELAQVLYSELSILEADEVAIEEVNSITDEEILAGNNIYEFLGWTYLEPIDRLGGITSNLLISIPAYESAGKTKLLCYLNDILEDQGTKCAFFAGETPEVKILNSIKSHAFYRMKEKILTWQQLANPMKIDDLELRAEVQLFNASYYKVHKPKTILSNLTVANFKSKIIEHYFKGVRVFLIDNPNTIPTGEWRAKGYGSVQETKSKVDYILEMAVELKKKYPITIIFTAWSNESGGLSLKDDGSTVENSRVFSNTGDYSKYSDCIIQFGRSKDLGEELRIFIIKKWREHRIQQKRFITDTSLGCCHFEYHEEIQHLLG